MLSQLNLNQLRVFQTVYFHRSMTKAAQGLFLTQSGVSQHIKNLEEALNIILFDRLGKNLVPTSMASHLYRECSKSMEALESALLSISKQPIEGSISLSAPPEFAQNILSPLLAELRNAFPGIIINLEVGLSSQMLQSLLDGRHSIAFMDNFLGLDDRMQAVKVFDEHLELCATKSVLNNFLWKSPHNFPSGLPMLAYLPGEPIIRKWYWHHYQKRASKLNVVAYLSNSQNIAKMIVLGQGAGILTGHHIKELKAQGHDLKIVAVNKKPLINPISLCRLKQRTISRLEKTVEDFLLAKFLA
jgi:LysR family transcriptional regulator, transcriptional activator of the cysJI operon